MRTIITFFLIVVYANVTSQVIYPPLAKNISKQKVIDSGNFRILYAFNAVNISDYQTFDDLQRLEIGKNGSKYYSYFVYNNDSLITDWKIRNPNANNFPNTLGERGKKKDWSEYIYSEYFKDFESNVFTEYSRMPYGVNTYYQYSEDIPKQNWEIKDDTTIIAKYLCQKAVCRFRGRNFTAWFAIEIPINNGPWKFGGLPGLILKVYDDDNLYVFECVGFENHKKKYPIFKYQSYDKYQVTTRRKLLKLQKSINEDYFSVANIRPMDPSKMLPIPNTNYKQLELE